MAVQAPALALKSPQDSFRPTTPGTSESRAVVSGSMRDAVRPGSVELLHEERLARRPFTGHLDVARLGFGSRGFGLRRRFAAAILEIRLIPAAALQVEARGRDELGQRIAPARRTNDERRVAEFLQRLELVLARRAAVFVDRHWRSAQRGITAKAFD